MNATTQAELVLDLAPQQAVELPLEVLALVGGGEGIMTDL